jgi:hypothetical protein
MGMIPVKPTEEIKKCTVCGIWKGVSCFHKEARTTSGLRSSCKVCTNTRLRESPATSAYIKSDRYKASQDKFWSVYRRSDRRIESNKFGSIRRKYGLSRDEYNEMCDKQKGLCAVHGCGRTASHIDHCHDTNLVRSLLCRQCNTVLGLVHESVPRLQGLIEYVRFYKSEEFLKVMSHG